jgi:hypothetical protein
VIEPPRRQESDDGFALAAQILRLQVELLSAADGAFQGAETAVTGVCELLRAWREGLVPTEEDLARAHAASLAFVDAVRASRTQLAEYRDRARIALDDLGSPSTST